MDIKKFNLNDLKPENDGSIHKKVASSILYAKILLYIAKQDTVTINNVKSFFKLDHGYAYRIIEFFTTNKLLIKVTQSQRKVIYKPSHREINKYIDIAYDKYISINKEKL